jgi:hypothetical protein
VKSWTAEPVGTVEPMEGCVPTTLRDGSPETPDTLNPAFCIALVAAWMLSPFTSGTVVVGGPVDTFTVTAEP